MTPEQIAALRTENSELKACMAAVRAGASGPGAGSGLAQVQASSAPVVTVENATDVLKGYALERDPLARGRFFDAKVAPVLARMGGREFSAVLAAALPIFAKNVEIQAANSLGTLSGTLIAQQSLGLLKYQFPLLARITRDFSNQSALLNQTIQTRIRAVPTTSAYTGTGFTAANAVDTDVPVTITDHRYVQITYNANELASTNRDLFNEQAQGSSYALGLYLVNALYALITPTNFSLGAQKTVQASGGFNRGTLQTMAAAMTLRGVGKADRTMLLNLGYYQQLGQDASVIAYDQYHDGTLITENVLPNVSGFLPVEVPNLPGTSNLTGFGMTPEALILATRIPNDYSTVLPGASYGNVSQVTDPNTGITVCVTQYVDHNAGSASYRVSLMLGVAVGDTSRGQLLVSA